MLKQINFPSLVYHNDIWKWSNLLQTPNNVKFMAAVYWKIKKRRGLQKGFLHYNTKIIITESNGQILGKLLVAEDWGELQLWYAFSTCHDSTSTGKETNLFYGHKFWMVMLSAITKKKTTLGKKARYVFFFFFFSYLFMFLAKRTALQKSNKRYFPVGFVLRASSQPNA